MGTVKIGKAVALGKVKVRGTNGEQGTAELGAKIILKETNKLCF